MWLLFNPKVTVKFAYNAKDGHSRSNINQGMILDLNMLPYHYKLQNLLTMNLIQCKSLGLDRIFTGLINDGHLHK